MQPQGTLTDLRLVTLAQLAPGGSWQLDLPHDRPYHVFTWITRGQGLALLDGMRRGVGTHNALFIPAGELWSLDLGRQGFGQALLIPAGLELTLPQEVVHLRIRDVASQNELTTLLEMLGREQNAARPLHQTAMGCMAELVAVWLRRHLDEAERPEDSATQRLMHAYAALVASEHASGKTMADLAGYLGVTPTHLTRVCRAATGKTAATLLTERVLHAARELLIGTEVPVRDIARHLGFGSAAYFTRFIQQHCSQTPTALRQAAQAAPPRPGQIRTPARA